MRYSDNPTKHISMSQTSEHPFKNLCSLPDELIAKVLSFLEKQYLKAIVDEADNRIKQIARYIYYDKIKIRSNSDYDIAKDPELTSKDFYNNLYQSSLIMSIDEFISFHEMNSKHPIGFLELSDEELLEIHKRYPSSLRQVVSIHVHCLNVSCISQLPQLPYNIERLDCPSVGAYHYVDDFEYPRTIKHLNISYGRFKDLRAFVKTFPYLETLVMSGVVIPLDGLSVDLPWLNTLGTNSSSLKKFNNKEIKLPDRIGDFTIFYSESAEEEEDIPFQEETPSYSDHISFNLGSCSKLKALTLYGNKQVELNNITVPPFLAKLSLVGISCIYHGEILQSLGTLNVLEITGKLETCCYYQIFKVFKFPTSLRKLVIRNAQFRSEIQKGLEDAKLELNECFNSDGKFEIGRSDLQLPLQLEELLFSGFPFLCFTEEWKMPPNLLGLRLSILDGFEPFSSCYLPRRLRSLEVERVGLGFLKDIQFPETLNYVSFDQCKICYVENTNLFELKNLRTLVLRDNTSSRTPFRIDQNLIDSYDLSPMKSLMSLDLSGIRFGDICAVKFPYWLEKLKLNDCKFCRFGKLFEFPINLLYLGLAKNNLLILEVLEKLPRQLKQLNMSWITTTKNEPIKISHNALEELFLERAKFDSFDFSLCNNLKKLSLKRTSHDLLHSAQFPISLEELDLNSATATRLVSDFPLPNGLYSNFARLSRLKGLDLRESIIQMFVRNPPEVMNLSRRLQGETSNGTPVVYDWSKGAYFYTEEEVDELTS
ncbi:uncharacterized protein J8A68_002685 [[Candida] subhashii]|uniref:Uncharacterized protein n=1 Tax=[Candida] subhashii TaxID=561895 RepID=A0A8J5QNV2_9ASCO|nr:uncharacterized protein J8A68_002685 [[Candida] subhashii]KAG7663825.1 hypothetical protein J8A68_002685 [[Candida] subhashii]